MTNHYIYCFRVPSLFGEFTVFQSTLTIIGCDMLSAKEIMGHIQDSAVKDVKNQKNASVQGSDILFSLISLVNVTDK